MGGNATDERSEPVWAAMTRVEDAPALAADERADVVVVGAGIAGLSAAYELARAGKSVVVLDRGALGGGMTARTTGHVSSVIDDHFHELVRVRGLDEARLWHESNAAAVNRLEEIQREEGIGCDFARIDGYLFLAPGTDPSILEKEFDAAREVGLADVAWAERAPIAGVDTGRCLRFPRQARFQPLDYLNGLIRCIRRDGGRLYANSPVVRIDEMGEEAIVTTASGAKVRADAAIVATNSPVNDRVAIHTKQAPYRTYAVAALVRRGEVADALYWDTLDAYHYVRLQPAPDGEHDYLIVGGEDHKAGTESDMDERLARLEAWTRLHFPKVREFTHRWSGQVYEPVDYAGFIGRNRGNANVYVATGDSGEGITNGIVAGMLLRDLVLGRENEWARLYDPGRVSLKAAGEFVRENLKVARNMAEHLGGGDVASVEELGPGQGAVVRQGASKVAAYRDEAGAVHLRSAVCTHAGCVVHWNPFEKVWDCPCHGSHFAIDGTPLQGPAKEPLAEVAPPEDAARR